MKFTYSLLLLLLLFSCQDENNDKNSESNKVESPSQDQESATQVESDEETELKSFDYYAGTIGLYGEDVLVEINTDKNEITGRYWYLKHGRQIQLNGTTSAKGNEWQMTESVKNVVTGHMTLEKNGDQLSGQWYAPGKESDIQEVELQKVYSSENGKITPNFETYLYSKTISIYNGEEDEEETASDELRLVRIGDYVLFQYFVIGHNAHVGHINGLAKMVSKNKAIFKGEEGCELSLTFDGKTVTALEEESCSYYRGMRAYFSGTLTKK
ncbi:MAG: hypothetical protein NXI10_13990 [bacterium]|nr:hypothetical protein [bacterium]